MQQGAAAAAAPWASVRRVQQHPPLQEYVAKAIARYAPHTRVTIIDAPIDERRAVIAASSADVLFACVDSMVGRSIAELVSRYFLIQLIDIGVTIPTRRDADGHPHVADVCGRIDFVSPDGPSLTDPGVVTAAGLRAEYLLANAPEAAKREIEAGYISGIHEEAPSVIALNMRAASDAVLEWIERQFFYRLDGRPALPARCSLTPRAKLSTFRKTISCAIQQTA